MAALYKDLYSTGAIIWYQSSPLTPPSVRPSRKRTLGEGFLNTLERFLQLTMNTWSMRRSAGSGSRSGGRIGPRHSINFGGRFRRAFGEKRKSLPALNASKKAGLNSRSPHQEQSSLQVASEMPKNSFGGCSLKNALSNESSGIIPRPVVISVIVVRFRVNCAELPSDC